MAYKVFISFKNLDAAGRPTRDSIIAAQLYRELKSRGVEVFFSNEEVQRRARPDYSSLIDEALESSRVLMLVGTRAEYIESKWVRYEWDSFKNEINSGRKDGYIIPILENITVAELPYALRHGQVYTSAEISKAADMAVGVLGTDASDDTYDKPVLLPFASMSANELYRLGLDFSLGGNGKTQNDRSAAECFREAAGRGHAESQYLLAVCCEYGTGVNRNPVEAAVWYRKAAGQGHSKAADALERLGYK